MPHPAATPESPPHRLRLAPFVLALAALVFGAAVATQHLRPSGAAAQSDTGRGASAPGPFTPPRTSTAVLRACSTGGAAATNSRQDQQAPRRLAAREAPETPGGHSSRGTPPPPPLGSPHDLYSARGRSTSAPNATARRLHRRHSAPARAPPPPATPSERRPRR